MKKWYMLAIGLLSFNLMADEWYDDATGFTWTYSVKSGMATITGVVPDEGVNLIIPTKVNGYDVVSILAKNNVLSYFKAFKGTLTLPDKLTNIGSYVFDGCSGFTGSVIIPNSVKYIGNYAFRGCEGFTGSLLMPDNITSIGDYVFSGCKAFSGPLKIPNTVTNIGAHAFFSCSGFTGVLNIPNGVVKIGVSAFSGCSGLSGTLTIPDRVTYIGQAAFSSCRGFSGVVIPNTVEDIANSVFSGCSGFSGTLTLPESVKTIGSYAFSDCGGFSGTLTIPDSVTTIGTSAFSGCDGFVDVFFKGLPPSGLDRAQIPTSTPFFSEKYAAEWKKVLAHMNLREPMREGVPVAKVISAKMRESDPTIMDVVYKVTSAKPTVKVRALAFQDGARSFAKVVRPETFVADENGNPTVGNIGDSITANEEHTLSWKVSADWQTTLAKVKFEVLAVEDEILPLELVTLPKTETQPKMVFSWNYVVPSRAFDALLWLYADKDLGITLRDGVLRNGDERLAAGANVSGTGYSALVYIYGKMGYELLQGERLNYVRERSRLDLPGISERQYAVKVIEE